MSNTVRDFEKFLDEYNDARAKFVEAGKTMLKEQFANIFNDLKGVTWIGWNQYTPYFNDGDPCVFRVSDLQYGYDEDPHIIDNAYEGLYAHTYGGSPCSDYAAETPEDMDEDTVLANQAVMQTFDKVFSKVPDEIFEEMFGDHCCVIATPTGFTVNEYEHD